MERSAVSEPCCLGKVHILQAAAYIDLYNKVAKKSAS
jgi:hypothetical protein